MFEKEAEERARKFAETQVLDDYNGGQELKCTDYNCGEVAGYEKGFVDGAEFGYNKANEWHYVANDDLPKVDNKIVLCVCGDGYVDGKRHYTLKLLTRKEFPLFQPVYAWKEIVPPELNEKEL